MPPRPPRRGTPTDGGVPAFFLYGEPLRAPDARTVHVETFRAQQPVRLENPRPPPPDSPGADRLARPIDAQLTAHGSACTAAFVIVPPLTVHSFQFGKQTDGWW